MIIVTLPYVTNHVAILQDANLHRVSRVFYANGLYDPDITGTGHQPQGYDQWGDLYRTATVLKSKISFLYNLTSDDSESSHLIAMATNCRVNQVTPWQAIAHAAKQESPSTVNRVFGPHGVQGNQFTLRLNYSAKGFWKRKVLTDLTQEVETNPSTDLPENGSAFVYEIVNTSQEGLQVVHVTTTIKYTIAFRHPRILSLDALP